MMPPLEGSPAAPWLLWRWERSPKPSVPWEHGWWCGELCRSKDGPFNVLSTPSHEEKKTTSLHAAPPPPPPLPAPQRERTKPSSAVRRCLGGMTA